jgi:hypothetical protein
MSEVVTIGGVNRTIYGTVAARNAYLSTSRRFAAAWAALSTEEKNMVSVDVMENFNVRGWKGTKTDDSQELAWPRTGATDGRGDTIEDDETPTIIEKASYLMAGLIALNPALLGAGQPQQQVQSLREGQVGASFYFLAPSETADNSGTPTVAEVEALIAEFMGDTDGQSIGSLMVPYVSGTDNPDNPSEFDGDKRYIIDQGLS